MKLVIHLSLKNSEKKPWIYLEHRFGCVALDIVSVDNNLNNAEPYFVWHIVAGNTDQVENHVHVPRVISGILLGENGNFQNLCDDEK